MKRMDYWKWLAGLLLTATVLTARAQEVTAGLSQDVTAVGQPVQLNISVTGGRGAQLPPTLDVDGLEARFAGKSEQMQMQMSNGRFQTTVTSVYTYLVIPLRQGTFTIPSIPVKVNGKTLKTAEQTLRVGGSSGGVPVMPAIPVQPQGQSPQVQTLPPSPRSGGRSSGEKVAFGDLLVPQKTAYAGEVVPVEVRFYFDATYQVRLQDRPGFSGDGFTVLRFSKPQERQQEIDGRIYNVVSFQTALTPAKSGVLEIPAATLEAQIQMPGRQRGMDDFFGGLFGSMGEMRQVTISTDPAQLEVKPLPRDGRPEDFSGAIGQFSLQAAASPKKAGAGDPITLTITVSGRGNFDGMGAPTLVETDGWRTYPPGERFEASPSDPIGFNGEKIFEYMILAREDQSATPVAEFSFFDPALEKYVTLKSPPIPVEIRGGVVAAPAPATVAAATPTPQGATPASPVPAPAEDLLMANLRPSSFAPFVESRGFLVANGVLALAWGAVLVFALGRMAAASATARKSALRRESRKLLKKVEEADGDTEQFYDRAVEFVRARLAPDAEFAHARELVESAPLTPETKAALTALLDRHDALKYSTGGAASLGAEERRQMVKTLKSFDDEVR